MGVSDLFQLSLDFHMVHDLLMCRMATSKLYVSEDMLRRAEEDTFALSVHSSPSVKFPG